MQSNLEGADKQMRNSYDFNNMGTWAKQIAQVEVASCKQHIVCTSNGHRTVNSTHHTCI